MREEKQLVEIWLTNAEKKDPGLQERLRDLYDGFKRDNYLVAVYESGAKDLYPETRDLLVYNRRRLAEIEARRGKSSRQQWQNDE